MRTERQPEVKIKKASDETEKTLPNKANETLFEGFYSYERPASLKEAEKFGEKLYKEYEKNPKDAPRLTFPFPLDGQRRKAMEMEMTGNFDEKIILDLLKDKDFANRIAGEDFLKKIKDLSKKGVAELQSILTNKEWTEKNKALAEKIKVKIILATQKEKEALDALLKMSQGSRSEEEKTAAIEGLGEVGDEGILPNLEQLLNQFALNSNIAKEAARVKIKILFKNEQEKALPVLNEMYFNRNEVVRITAAEALGNFYDKRSLEILKKGEWDTIKEKKVGELAIYNIIRNIAEKEGEKSMPWLKEMARNEKEPNYVKRAAVQALTRLALKNEDEKAAEEILKENFKEFDKEEIKEWVDFEKNKHPWLIAHQKGLFATPHTKKLINALGGAKEICRRLKKEFGNRFIGLTVFGSASKGYFGEDIDLALVAQEKAKKEIDEFLRKQELPSGHLYEFHEYLLIGSDDEFLDLFGESRNLFRGISFCEGNDYNRLVELQKKFLERTDDNEWDRIRKDIMERETENLEKFAERFGIFGDELEKVRKITILSRTPPTREDALKIVRKRLSQT